MYIKEGSLYSVNKYSFTTDVSYFTDSYFGMPMFCQYTCLEDIYFMPVADQEFYIGENLFFFFSLFPSSFF